MILIASMEESQSPTTSNVCKAQSPTTSNVCKAQSPTTSNVCKAQSSEQCGSVQKVLDNKEQTVCVAKDSGEHAEENVTQFQNDSDETLYAKNRQLIEESNEKHVDENTEQEGYQNMGQQTKIDDKQNFVNISVDKKIGHLLAETSDQLQEKCSIKSVMEISGRKGDDNNQQSYIQNNEYHYVLRSKMEEEKTDGCFNKNGVRQPFGNDIVTPSVKAIEASNTGALLSVFVDVKDKQREQDCITIVSSSVLGESSHLVMGSREDSILCTMESEDSHNCVCNSPDIDSSSAVDKTFESVCRTLTGIERACTSKGCKDLSDEIPQQDSLTPCSSTPDLLEGGICLEDQRSPPKCCRLQPGCTGDHVCTRHFKQQLRSVRPISEREGIFVSQPMPTDQASHPSQGSQMEDMDVGLNERLYYSSDLPDLNGTNLEEYLPLTDVTNTSSTLDDTNEVPIDSMVDEHKDMNHGDNIRDECVDSQVDNDGGNKSLKHDHGNQEESRNYPGYFEVVQHDECTQLQETSAHGEEAYQSSTENQIKEDSEVESSSCMSEDGGVTTDDEDTLSSEEVLSIQKSEDTGRTSCFTPDVDDHRGPSPEMACLSHGSSDYMCRKQNNARIIPHLVVHPGELQQNYMENIHTPLHFDQNEESTSSNSNTYPFLNAYANNLRYGDVNLAEINIARKGLKRKFDDPYNQHVPESRQSYYKDGVYSSLSQHAEYNYLCQYYQGYGRPPDVSTWTAVTSPFSQYPYTAPCSAWKGLNYNMIASDQADSRDNGVLLKNPPAYPSDPFFSSHYYPPTACTSSKAVSEGYPPSYYNHMTANMSVPSSFSAVNHNEMFATPTSVTQEPSMYDKQGPVNFNQRYQYANTNMSCLQQAWSDTNLVNTGPNIQVFSENTNPTNPQYTSFNYCGEDQRHMDTKRSISSSLRDTLVPFKARNTKIVCTVNDLYTKTVKSILKKAEENYQQEKDGVVLPQDLSIHKPTEASLKLTEQYRSECRSKSPISALSSALDLSQKSANKRKQLQYAEGEMIGQPAVAVPVVLSSSMITSHSESSCSSDATSISATSVVSSSASRQEVSGTEVSTGYCMPLFQKGAYPAGTLLQAVPNCFGPIRSSLVSPYYSVLPVYPKSSPYQHPSAMMTAIPLYANKVPSVQNQVQIQPAAAAAASPCEEVTGCTSQQYGTQVTGYHNYPLIHAATHGDQGYDPTNVGVPPSVLSYLPGPACKQDVKVVPSTGQTKKTFKPRHFDFTKLCIGTFMYTCALNDYSRTARIKFLFSKRKLVYEFQLNDINDVSTTERKQLTEIDIPFNSIVGLWTCERELRLEVSCPPKMFLGHKGHEKQRKFGVQTCAVYDRKKTVDLTNGQLTSVPYHYIHLKMCVGDKIKSELCSFDTRFEELLKKSFIVNSNKSLVSPDFDPSLSHPLLYPIPPRSGLTQVPAVQSSTSPGRVRQSPLLPKKKGSLFAGCHCIHSCRSLQCSCCAHTESCTPACVCRNCRNPLNLLLRMGIPSAIAQTDSCLMDNIYTLDNLDEYLNATVRLECCGIQMLLLRCVPGSFKCPNTHCNVHYRFSWCHAMLCNEGVAPRNHCTKCGRCTDFRNVHCQKCNKCYFAGVSGFKCPTCKVEEMERNQQSPAEEP